MPLPKANLSAKEKARNKRAIPPKKERQRMRSSKPRRRLAKQAAGERRLTPKNLTGGLLKILNSLEKHSQQIWLIKDDSPLIVGRTGKKRGSMALRLGAFIEPKTGEAIPIIGKVVFTVPLEEEGKLFVGGPMAFSRHAENARIIRSMGIPTYKFMKHINIGKRSQIDSIFMEDLTKNGRLKVIDLIDCNSRQVSNMGEIRKDADEFIQRLLNKKLILIGKKSHAKNPDMRNEMERAFFVIIDPKTREGKVFAGDLDHFVLLG